VLITWVRGEGSEIKLDKNTKDQNMRLKQSSGNPLWGGSLLITSNLDIIILMFFPMSCPNYPIRKKKEERDISHPMLNRMVNHIK
jgi:hypothetical protein